MSLNLTQITEEAMLSCPKHTISSLRGNITYVTACINTNATIGTDAQCLTIPTSTNTTCVSLRNLINSRNKSRICSTSCQLISSGLRGNNSSSVASLPTASSEPTYSGFRPMFSTNSPFPLPTYTLSSSSPSSAIELYPNFSLVVLFFLFLFLLKH